MVRKMLRIGTFPVRNEWAVSELQIRNPFVPNRCVLPRGSEQVFAGHLPRTMQQTNSRSQQLPTRDDVSLNNNPDEKWRWFVTNSARKIVPQPSGCEIIFHRILISPIKNFQSSIEFLQEPLVSSYSPSYFDFKIKEIISSVTFVFVFSFNFDFTNKTFLMTTCFFLLSSKICSV